MSTPAKPEKSKKERERQDWVIVLLILLLGLCCVAGAGQYALRFAPSWQLDTNMESNIDLNSQFLTGKPQEFFEPLDPAILTQPGWVSGNIFLTPGAGFTTGTPLSTSIVNTLVPTTVGTTAVATNTIVVTSTTVPTNTLVWIPVPATKTSKPHQPPVDTATNPPPPDVDLQISMTDRGVSYIPNGILIYTVVVTNNSTITVNNVPVSVTLPIEITTAGWTCSAAGGATCTPGGSGGISDTINLPAGAFVTYTITADAPGVATTLNGSASVTTPAGYNEIAPFNNTVGESTAALTSNVNIGPGDGNWTSPGSGGSITMVLSTPINADGVAGTFDFVYYERVAPPPAVPPVTDPRVDVDWVQILISSDGIIWQQVFYWGDPGGSPDTNTNVAYPIDFCPTEIDNCSILSTSLYDPPGPVPGTGITIDTGALSGSYPWVQIICPTGDDGDGCDIDAIQPYYP